MRDKTPLALIEQMIMIAVFAFAAAVCLRIFVHAADISKRNEAVSYAVLLAQNTAEQLKASSGKYGDNAKETVGEWTYRVEILHEESKTAGLGCAKVIVWGSHKQTEQQLFEIRAAWQEETGND